MIFLNKIFLFYPLQKHILFFLQTKSYFFNFQNKSNFSFKREHIHKADLLKLIFVKCLSCALYHIIQHHAKMIYNGH